MIAARGKSILQVSPLLRTNPRRKARRDLGFQAILESFESSNDGGTLSADYPGSPNPFKGRSILVSNTPRAQAKCTAVVL